ncbi:hypothetical protein F975_00481 [Acinetobacter sp. ANC 3789]|uniref:hypothetical protein n=1 Tax=Acinetobacter sp. ANC 3789 TaxID=1217714 RepID=UPI0002CF0F5A|nr:hypothetical protein [Acinetobacter sp. ANC 3789]ENU81865.1 hypothetical protein F975_00481 [Acinetobacter sp. ANC 3789]
MLTKLQQDAVIYSVLDNLFKIVVMYSCEKVKIQEDYRFLYLWFNDTMDELIYPRVNEFLNQYIDQRSDSSISYQLVQTFWMYAQKKEFLYDETYLNIYGFDKNDLKLFFQELYAEFRSVARDHPDADDFWDLTDKFDLSSFLSKSRLNEAFFTYFYLYYILTKKISVIDDETFIKLFTELLDQIPYHSPFNGSTLINGSISLNTKSYWTTLKIPLNFEPFALLDNLFQFLFKFLQNSFVHAVNEEKFKDPHIYKQRLQECVIVMEALFKTITEPSSKSQLRDYRVIIKGKSLHKIVMSLMFKNFQQHYHLKHKNIDLDKKNAKKEAVEVYSAFIDFLVQGFEKYNIKVKCEKNNKHIDDWRIILKLDNIELDEITGNQLRVNLRNHSKLFKFPQSQNMSKNYVVPVIGDKGSAV